MGDFKKVFRNCGYPAVNDDRQHVRYAESHLVLCKFDKFKPYFGSFTIIFKENKLTIWSNQYEYD